jgi:hypothetical protein
MTDVDNNFDLLGGQKISADSMREPADLSSRPRGGKGSGFSFAATYTRRSRGIVITPEAERRVAEGRQAEVR